MNNKFKKDKQDFNLFDLGSDAESIALNFNEELKQSLHPVIGDQNDLQSLCQTVIQANQQIIKRAPRNGEDFPTAFGYRPRSAIDESEREFTQSKSKKRFHHQIAIDVDELFKYDDFPSSKSGSSCQVSIRDGDIHDGHSQRVFSANNQISQVSPMRASFFQEEKSRSSSVVPPPVDHHQNQSDQINQAFAQFFTHISNIFQEFDVENNQNGRIITIQNYENYRNFLIDQNQNQNQNNKIPKNYDDLAKSLYFRLKLKTNTDFSGILDQNFDQFKLSRYMIQPQHGQEVNSKLGLVLRYEEQIVVCLRPSYLNFAIDKDESSKVYKLAGLSFDFYDEIYDWFNHSILFKNFELFFNSKDAPRHFYQRIKFSQFNKIEVSIDDINAKTIANAITNTSKNSKRKTNSNIADLQMFNRFAEQFGKYLNDAKEKINNQKLMLVGGEKYIYQSKLIINQEEQKEQKFNSAKYHHLIDYLQKMVDNWKHDFESYLGRENVIKILVNKPESFSFLNASNTTKLQLITTFDQVLTSRVFGFIQFQFDHIKSLIGFRKPFINWDYIETSEFEKLVKSHYSEKETQMKSYSEKWLGEQIQEKKIQPFTLCDQLRIQLCKFGDYLRAQEVDQRPVCYDPCFNFPEFSVLPIMLGMHSGFIHFSPVDDDKNQRSVLLTGPTNAGKSFWMENYNYIFKGKIYSFSKVEDKQWFGYDSFGCNSWRIDELTPVKIFSDFIKQFADYSQQFSVPAKFKEDIVLPRSRQVIVSTNMAFSQEGFKVHLNKVNDQFESQFFSPVCNRFYIIYAQQAYVQQSRTDERLVSVDTRDCSLLITADHIFDKDYSKTSAQIFLFAMTYLLSKDERNKPKQFNTPEEKRALHAILEQFEKTIFGFLVMYNLEEFDQSFRPYFLTKFRPNLYKDFEPKTEQMEYKQRDFLFTGYLSPWSVLWAKKFPTKEHYLTFTVSSREERLLVYEQFKLEVQTHYKNLFHTNGTFKRVSPLYLQKKQYLTD